MDLFWYILKSSKQLIGKLSEVDAADSLRARSQKRATNAGTLERDQLKESEKEVNAEEIRSAV